jgi:hypothetical protein
VIAPSKTWVCGLKLAGTAVSNPAGGWMSVFCTCYVLSDRAPCNRLITRPEKSCWMWCVWEPRRRGSLGHRRAVEPWFSISLHNSILYVISADQITGWCIENVSTASFLLPNLFYLYFRSLSHSLFSVQGFNSVKRKTSLTFIFLRPHDILQSSNKINRIEDQPIIKIIK